MLFSRNRNHEPNTNIENDVITFFLVILLSQAIECCHHHNLSGATQYDVNIEI